MNRLPRALLLDVDNTLIDRVEGFARYADRLLDLAGLSGDVARRGQLIDIDAGCYRDRDEWAAATIAAMPELGWSEAALQADFAPRIVGLIPDPVQVRAALSSLRGRVTLVACTNGPAPLQNSKLDVHGLRPLLDGAVISGELGIRKPAPGIFAAALAEAGCAPEQAWMVGDNAEHDIGGAQACGIPTVWVAATWRRFQGALPEGVTPTRTVESVLPLLAWLDEVLPA